MRVLGKRVDALETRRAVGFRPYRCIRQYGDQTEAEAIALHEGGPVDPESENLLYVVVRKPFPSPLAA